MKTGRVAPTSVFLSLILTLTSGCWREADKVTNVEPAFESAAVRAMVQPGAQRVQVPESTPTKASPEPAVVAKNPLAEISFEKTVCDLGQVGLGTKNTCEFKFTNTGPAPLRITNVKRTLSVS